MRKFLLTGASLLLIPTFAFAGGENDRGHVQGAQQVINSADANAKSFPAATRLRRLVLARSLGATEGSVNHIQQNCAAVQN